MVEGPGCKQNGEKLRSKVLGQKVRAVCGAVTNNTITSFSGIIGLDILEIKTLGKELFVYFDKDICIKIHFMFNGCFRFGSDNRNDLKNEEPVIKIDLTKESFCFYYGKVTLAPVKECEQKYKELIDFDICSPSFNAQQVQSNIMKHPNRLICDVLLDQHILPGVGNVIKNESLFMAGISPSTYVKELSLDIIGHCVLKTREFTMQFAKLRQKGSWSKETKASIHGHQKCIQCSGRIRVCKLGENKRLTYFCPNCQNNSPVITTISTGQENPSMSPTHIPSKVTGKQNQSISKWFKPTISLLPWSCQHCTLINRYSNDKCEVCLQPKELTQDKIVDSPTEYAGVTKRTFNVKVESEKRKSTEKENISAKFKFKKLNNSQDFEKQPNTKSSEINKFKSNTKSITKSNNLIDSTHTKTNNLIDSTNTKTNNVTSSNTTKTNNLANSTNSVVCSGHKKTAKKAQVSKNNENKGRPFFSCGQPQKCNFFKWADDHHPKCSCGRISIQRQCYKNNANNGRYFYCCSQQKGSQCTFFQWVE
ncbi:unnamed protein product [Meganyctiphanes norvegica]|uniref:Endonuclease 8-like 3 n=1 Tax=Meganyctiphanes norvegica TaxID=48144 RepID=A0AAV2RE66_MEGNR